MALKEFMAQLRSRGVAMRSHYLVEILPPPMLMNSATTIPLLPLFCEQAMFPEFALATTTIKDYGLNREVVYDKTYGSVTLTFACDQQMLIKQFFDVWSRIPVSKDGGIFAYPSDYIVPELRMYQLDAKKQQVYSVTLKHAYPKIVNDIFLNASDKSYSNFQVVFAYESWESNNFAVDMSGPPPAPYDEPPDLTVPYNKPKRIVDIARILDYAGGLSREGLKSAIVTRGTMVVQDILTSTGNGLRLGNLL